ncbi:MAG: hypothetical protein JWN33_257 [Candidatus Saccharibacteria bacterium]|nr:hypothetical protein [Candidatus Saccharibacteria bacterium]
MSASQDLTQKTMEAFSRLPETDTPTFSSRLNPEYQRKHIALSLTPGNVLLALHRAREAREVAVSHRNFRVGAAITALSVGGPAMFKILTGINYKPGESRDVNVHAEQLALLKATDRHLTAASIVAVVGETQLDQQSGHTMHTLHPCGLCRDVMKNHPLVDPDATLIVSALPTFRTIEMSTINELDAFHNDEQSQAEPITRFEFPPLKLFEPFVPEPGQTSVEITDTEEDRQEERLWDSSVGVYLMKRRLELLDQR